MKQIIQNYKNGELKLEEVPSPQLNRGSVLVKVLYSLISAGTEKTKIDTAQKSLIGKAQSRPDLVKQVLEKVKKEGIWKTWQTVSQRLNAPISLGYSCAGIVLNVGEDVSGLQKGDLVACGGEFANHAEIVSVPKNLVVRVPEGVNPDHAAFATIGAIAMQGVRQAEVQIGEKVAVIGLGLIGLLTVQILNAAGCQVIGIDTDSEKLPVGLKLGCKETVSPEGQGLREKVLNFTNGHGVDSTIITAGTHSNRPVEQAGEITRHKGKVIIVGAVGMNIPREPYYAKEIDLRISRSYGPGRYDKDYEEKGHDYPYGYVRFTEQRNMESFLELVQDKRIDLTSIVTHRFPFEESVKAYELIQGEKKENYLGILLEYKKEEDQIFRRVELSPPEHLGDKIVLGVIGAGNYATANLLPHLKSHPDISLGSICTSSGMTALNVAKKFGFKSAESDIERIIKESDAILIATRHNTHANYALRALEHGKPVIVEKPLCLNIEDLQEITNAYYSALSTQHSTPLLMVGFNRRFSPAIEMIKNHFQNIQKPKQILIRINAGPIPSDHWIQDPEVGGGRLIGEGCHFVDLAVSLTDNKIETVSASAIPKLNSSSALWDEFSITLRMEKGSIGTIIYSSIGDRGVPKEYIEVFCEGKTGIIKDFQSVELWSNGKRKTEKWSNIDKGQKRQLEAWIKGLKKGESPIPFDQIINVHKACFAAIESIRTSKTIKIRGLE
jgi:polar amino acid transport system substrate-binding protein